MSTTRPRAGTPGTTGTEHYSRCSRLRDECFPQATLNEASELLRISPRQTADPGKHSFAPTALMKAATINNASSLTGVMCAHCLLPAEDIYSALACALEEGHHPPIRCSTSDGLGEGTVLTA